MKQYLELLSDVLQSGRESDDRAGIGTISVFGRQIRFNLCEGLPLLTTKALHLPSILHELLWFLKGETNVSYLQENGVKIWDSWATESGDLGAIYGEMWRSWPTTDGGALDQISRALWQLRNTPDSRRIVVTAWNPEFIPLDGISPQQNVLEGKAALAPCHCLFQFYTEVMTVHERLDWYVNYMDGYDTRPLMQTRESLQNNLDELGVPTRRLSCHLYQRSADVFLGVPFNIASYALLTMMVAQQTDMAYGTFIHTFGDLHLYKNHFRQAGEQLMRTPDMLLPKVTIHKAASISDYKYEDFDITGYAPQPNIKAPVAV